MFRTSHTVNTLAKPEEVWALVKDSSKWGSWLLGVEHVHLNGQLAPGAQGSLHLSDNNVHPLTIQKCDLGLLEMSVNLSYGVKMQLMVDVSSLPQGSRVRLEGVLLGAMAIMHLWSWGKNLKAGMAPAARRLGSLSQGMSID